MFSTRLWCYVQPKQDVNIAMCCYDHDDSKQLPKMLKLYKCFPQKQQNQHCSWDCLHLYLKKNRKQINPIGLITLVDQFENW